MALPIILKTGMVAVYGNCQQSLVSSDGSKIENYRYGTIYHIWDGGGAYAAVGDLIAFPEENINCRVVTSNNLTYTIVPARLATKQDVAL